MSAFDAEQTVQILANNEKQTIEKRIERTKEVVDSLKSIEKSASSFEFFASPQFASTASTNLASLAKASKIS